MSTFIGIDGGGTKTSAVAADERGTVLGQVTAGPTNPNGDDIERIRTVFHTIKQQLTPFVSDWEDAVVFAGIAGVIHPVIHRKVSACLREVFSGVARLDLDHDGMNALAAVTYGDPGVVQIAGTGSLTFGLGKQGKRCRIGGWGYLIGDEGSGFDLGRRALIRVMKAYDGRGPATGLTELALRKWDLDNPEDLVPHVYNDAFKKTISSFSYELFQAAENGDAVARDVIDEAAEELAESIHTAIRTVDLAEEHALVGLTGGAFQLPLIHALEQSISERIPQPPRLVRSQVEPVIGSLAWAYTCSGLDPRRLLNHNHQ